MQPSDLLPPFLLESFDPLQRLGRGATGLVVRAWDKKLKREVVFKVLQVTQADLVARFHREARILARMRDPAIMEILDFGSEGDSHYLVSPYHAGSSLDDILRDQGHLEWPRALHLAQELSRALSLIHEKGILHRDIKPANLFVTDEGQPMLLDFGMGLLAGATVLTRAGQVLCTPLYAAPEMLTSATLDARGDLYSLGLVLYEALTGENPMNADTIVQVMSRQCNLTLERLPPSCDQVPIEFGRAVIRLLRKEPADRYQTAAELHEVLCRPEASARPEVTDVTLPQGLPAVPPTPTPTPARKPAPRPIPWGTLLPLLIGLLGATFYFNMTDGRPTVPEPPGASPLHLHMESGEARLLVQGASHSRGTARLTIRSGARSLEQVVPLDDKGVAGFAGVPGGMNGTVTLESTATSRLTTAFRTPEPLEIWDGICFVSNEALLLDFDFASTDEVVVELHTHPDRKLLQRRRSRSPHRYFHERFVGLSPATRYQVCLRSQSSWGPPIEFPILTADPGVAREYQDLHALGRSSGGDSLVLAVIEDARLPQALESIKAILESNPPDGLLIQAAEVAGRYRDVDLVSLAWSRIRALDPPPLGPVEWNYLLTRMALSRHPEARQRMVESLAAIGPEEDMGHLHLRETLGVLGRQDDPAAFDQMDRLLTLFGDKFPDEGECAQSMIRADRDRAATTFRRWLTSPVGPFLAGVGLHGIDRCGTPEDRRLLERIATTHLQASVRDRAIRLLVAGGDGGASLAAVVGREHPEDIGILAEMEALSADATPRLEAVAYDPKGTSRARARALMQLALLREPPVSLSPRILEALTGSDGILAQAGAWAAGHLRFPAHTADLVGRLKAGDPVAPVAVWALGQFPGGAPTPETLRYARGARGSQDPHDRMGLGLATRFLDAADPATRTFLTEVAADTTECEWVRGGARRRLEARKSERTTRILFTFAPALPFGLSLDPAHSLALGQDRMMSVEGIYDGISGSLDRVSEAAGVPIEVQVWNDETRLHPADFLTLSRPLLTRTPRLRMQAAFPEHPDPARRKPAESYAALEVSLLLPGP